MNKKLTVASGLAALLFLAGGALARLARVPEAPVAAFEELSMHLEVDLPSPFGGAPGHAAAGAPLIGLPAEVVLEAALPEGCVELCVLDGAGKSLVRLACPDRGALGVSEVALECEGATLADALRAMPPGDYRVEALTVNGGRVEGRVTLHDGFPGLFAVVSPLPGEVVSAKEVTLTWTPARGAARYTLEVEQAELGFELETSLPPWQQSFTLPSALLEPGRTYEYSLAVRGDTDNELEIEGTFVTAAGGLSLPSEAR
jgi:hypothetical protein